MFSHFPLPPSKEEEEEEIEDCISNTHQQIQQSYSMTDQDMINDQIATINSLTISDQHPMDTILDTRPPTSTAASMPFRNIFTDTNAFTPQFSDEPLFRNNSFSFQSDYPNQLMRNYHLDSQQQHLARRESFPNLSSAYNMTDDTASFSQWNPNSFLNVAQKQQLQQQHRKFSMDAPPSFASKRLDILDKSNSRLTPSYSNPDLASARRMSSLDAGLPRSSTFVDDLVDPTCGSSSSRLGQIDTMYQHRFPMMSNTASAPPLMSPSTTNNMNPLLASHLMRQMSISHSRPPSPTISRKNSFQQQQLRRTSSATTMNVTAEQDRFASIRLEDVVDEIYSLCKDQYGCRFFQKKLEEQNPDQRDIIFTQIYPHFVELMTDPFGNYLCQKMMEYCTDAQRTQIVEQVASAMITISLNMHGTRAVQKMIEFLTLPEQIAKTIEALSPNVVTLIKDINGNHVIQKCLHRLSFADKQFVYDAVSENCVEVATHRHGCCVLQRCVDFSAESQKAQLVNEIIKNALTLVQDPYGNYVVQYVLELGDAQFSDKLIRQFIGHIGGLSVQKYSSNVMEKCIRVAEEDTRRHLIEEMVNRPQLEKLIKDSYANYVVQTALDFAEESQHQKLGDCIRPLLPSIRNTSYCKRIQNKLNRQSQQQTFQYQQQQQQQQQSFFQPNYTLSGQQQANIHPLSDFATAAPNTSPFVGNIPHYNNYSATFTNP